MLNIDGDACVHARSATSRCTACVDACPRGAWTVDWREVAFQPDACDGCGVCVPACPAGVLELAQPPRLRPDGAGCACLVCERSADDGTLEADALRLPCVHGLSEARILQAHGRGLRRLELRTGDCGTCPRGGGQPLTQRLAALNRALLARGAAPVVLAGTEDAVRGVRPEDARRSFFRRFFERPGAALAEGAGGNAEGSDRRRDALERLARLGPGPGLWSVVLDPARCNGCGVCATLCPELALGWLEGGGQAALRFDAARCTGCQLCVEVCDRDALRPAAVDEAWPGGPQHFFQVKPCRRCHAPIRRGATASEDADLCTICAVATVGRSGRLVVD